MNDQAISPVMMRTMSNKKMDEMSQDDEEGDNTRIHFPESWLFDLYYVGLVRKAIIGIRTYTYTYSHTYSHSHNTHIHSFTCTTCYVHCTYTRARTHTRAHILACTHKHTHTHIYTYMCMV